MKRILLAAGIVVGILTVLGVAREARPWKRLQRPGAGLLAAASEVIELRPRGLDRQTPSGPTPRVDRCATCHFGAVRPAATPNPARPLLAPHPRPELFVAEGSPHPASSFGCTICHGGEGRATDFSRAGHWPVQPVQEAAWKEAWSFDRDAVPAEPILPPTLLETRCPACHVSVPREVDSRRVSWNRVAWHRDLIERLGCAGCHELGRQEPAVPGPPLDRLAAKTTPGWAFRFIAAPRLFRASSWMPHLFSPRLDEARRDVAVRAMVSYLWQPRGAPRAAAAAPPEGNAEAGAALFGSVGCTGCHVLGAARRDAIVPERLHGPDLVLSGNKLQPAWLYAWLKNPRALQPSARMPDLRLSDQEAADLTAFLTASRDPSWDGLELPPIDALLRDAMVREALLQELSADDAEARFAAMRSDDKELFLGRWALSGYGCAGCHAIPGIIPPAPFGAPLDQVDARRLLAGLGRSEMEGSPLAHRGGVLAFDGVVAPPGVPAPDYGLSRAEADAVLAELLSRRTAPVAVSRRAAGAVELARGRRLLRRSGCLGCHRLAGRGGAVADTLESPSLAPPGLDEVGARYLSAWLFAYLEHPERDVRRPWLKVRMPSYRLSTEDANAVVHYFAARDARPLLTSPLQPARKVDLEVGRAVTAILDCVGCHADDSAARDGSVSGVAPSYRGAAARLRPDWVVAWILDPRSRLPGTAMPVTFTREDGGGYDASFLPSTLQAPMFEDRTKRLRSHFASEDELWAYLGDAERVAAAIRNYLWSLEPKS